MLKHNFLLCPLKLIEYFFSAVNVVSSNPCVGISPRTKISFFLLEPYTEELPSTPKIITFYEIHQ